VQKRQRLLGPISGVLALHDRALRETFSQGAPAQRAATAATLRLGARASRRLE
jgi:hypothetical protein